MTIACPVCHRRQDDGILCHRCTCKIEDALNGVPELIAELETTRARQGRDVADGKGGLAHERNGYHKGGSDADDDLANALTHWAKAITGAHPSIWLTTSRPAELAATMLLGHIRQIRTYIGVGELYEGVLDATAEAWRACDRAANRTIIPVGPCPEEDENGTPCPGIVFAFIPTEDDRPSRMECKANPVHKWSSVQWLRTGKRILDVIEQRKREARVHRAVFGEDVA